MVTVHTVVYIPVNTRVVEVSGTVSTVAGRALEYGIIIRICMARGANSVRVAMVDGELRVVRVRERCTGPGRRRVARRASSRE